MSLPTTIFLDTSIFVEQQFNFNSVALTSFVPAAKKQGVELLIPDPTIREIRRQIKQRSEDALKALDEARRKAPFLRKWKHFPAEPSSGLRTWEVSRIAEAEWNAFLNQFKVVHLGYDDVPIATVMDWYDAQSAPFGERKRKEFPDAFAVAALLGYTIANSCSVAVVSKDNDFKLACNRFHSLLYFPSLPHLTELLLLDDGHLDEVRAIVYGAADVIEKKAVEACKELVFFSNRAELSVRKGVVHGVSIPDMRIVAIGHGECTVTFEGKLESEHYMEWHDFSRESAEVDETFGGWVVNYAQVTGTAKLALDLERKVATNILLLELETKEVEVKSVPSEFHIG